MLHAVGRNLQLVEDRRLQALKDEIAREYVARIADQRRENREHYRHTRQQWDRLRESVRSRYFAEWSDDVSRKLGRERSTLRLLDTAKTYALQDASEEAGYLWRLGRLPGFEREIPIEQMEEIDRLISKLIGRLPDSPIHLLLGVSNLWLVREPGRVEVWGNGSSYFGAVETTSIEVLSHAIAWLDSDDPSDMAMMSAADTSDELSLFIGADQRGTFCILQLIGPCWGRLLSDERSDWDYSEWVDRAARLRARRGA
jgi:hypothetical protein